MSKSVRISGNAHNASPEQNATKYLKEQRDKIVDDNQALLGFLVEKLRVQCQSHNNELEVKDEIHCLLLDDEIPENLIPKPKPLSPLTMMKQGIYPPWMDEITPIVIELLTGKRTLGTIVNEKFLDILKVIKEKI